MRFTHFLSSTRILTAVVVITSTFSLAYAAIPTPGAFGEMFKFEVLNGGYKFIGGNIKDGTVDTAQLSDCSTKCAVESGEIKNTGGAYLGITGVKVDKDEVQLRPASGIKCPQMKDGSPDLSYAIKSVSVDGVANCIQVASGTSAPPPSPVDGTCGTAAKNYLSSDTAFNGTMCGAGNGITTPSSPVFPAQGDTVGWICGGSGGGNNSGNCFATRTSSTYSCTGTDPANATLIPGDDASLIANTAKTLVTSNTAAKCQFMCDSGYSKVGGVCTAVVNYCTAGGTIPCIVQ